MLSKKVIFVFSSLVSTVISHVIVSTHGECGTAEPTENHIIAAQKMAVNDTIIAGRSLVAKDSIEIPLYVHIVVATADEQAKASKRDIDDTIQGMNQHYAAMGFHFNLREINVHINSKWSSGVDDLGMRNKLHKGDYQALNIYYVNTVRDSTGAEVNGRCNLPIEISGANTIDEDGCIIKLELMTNGQTTIHEVGHWLGLFHTFRDGCQGEGDFVDDTPACRSSWTCDAELNTCPEVPGNDPVNNFMSYGFCRDSFTAGQAEFARRSYYHYRS